MKMKYSNILLTPVIAASVLFAPTNAFAEYCAVSKIKGNVCSGFVIEACKFVVVDAVKRDDGKLYELSRCYESVSDYSESKGRCWVRTKSKGAGLFSWGVNAADQPEFYHLKDDGTYEEIDVEYLSFKCRKS